MPILIELFTSQGCSSCPPAEELLNGMGMKLFQAGKALPLCFHVDYWDNLGWKDPFSSPLFTDRQRQYILALNSTSLYTPEMVVSGRSGFVGSDAERARQEIGEMEKAKAVARITLSTSRDKGKITLRINLQPMAGLPLGGPWKVMIAVFENHLITHVEEGENKGRDLTENFVVRRLVEAKRVSLEKPEWINTTLSLEPEWQKPYTGLAVFLEDESTLKTGAVNWVYPIAP